MADASLLLQQAAEARAQASHARDLARAVTDDHGAAALTALADELERRASELQQQATDAAAEPSPKA
jgi:predicted  nucleic acid-binding Zn-ribbon protein